CGPYLTSRCVGAGCRARGRDRSWASAVVEMTARLVATVMQRTERNTGGCSSVMAIRCAGLATPRPKAVSSHTVVTVRRGTGKHTNRNVYPPSPRFENEKGGRTEFGRPGSSNLHAV